jgi:glycosyltransferase involved in cell wall biosynthesis
MILTFNEEANIGRTLSKLTWAKKIVVVDSGSADHTLDIVGRFPQAVVISRPFDTPATQCNFGLQHIDSEWVMSMDADYVLSDELVAELAALLPDEATRGYNTSFVYKIGGRPLRGSLYPSRTVLYRRAGSFYEDDGHTQRVRVEGRIRDLKGPVYHDDHKPLARWFRAQMRYSMIEAEHLLSTSNSELSRLDRVRLLIVPAPFLIFVYVLIVKGGLLDGWRGWYYAMQRLCAEVMLSVELFDRRFKSSMENG